MKMGDLVAVISSDYEFVFKEKLALVVSVDEEYMGGLMCTVLLDGEMFSVHENEARILRAIE